MTPKRLENGKDSSEPTKSEAKIPPPDGGWGWMVVLGSFFTHVIADGIVYSFGIFYIEFLTYFGKGKGETAWAGSLITGMMLLVGPLGSSFINKYGCRVTSMTGACLAATGFILTVFSPNLYFLLFSFGIVSGVGVGLIYLPSIVIVGHYFEKRRALALGISIAGSGIGSFIFSPLSKYLIDSYGWRGAILLEAGFMLNCAVCGALFIPLEKQQSLQRKSLRNENKSKIEKKENDKDQQSIKKEKRGQEKSNFSDLYESEEVEIYVANTKNYLDIDGVEFVLITPKASPKQKRHPVNQLQTLFVSDGVLERTPSGKDFTVVKNKIMSVVSSGESSTVRVCSSNPELCLSLKDSNNKDRSCKETLYIGDTHDAGPTADASEIPLLEDKIDTTIDKIGESKNKNSKSIRARIPRIFDFSLFSNKVFLLYVISNFCTSLVIDSIFIFLADRALDSGISVERSKWILSATGIANTPAKILAGFIADLKGVNPVWLYIGALVVTGMASALSPFYDSYPLLMMYGCVIGFFVGGYVSLNSIVLIHLVGQQLMTNGLGLMLMFKGISILVGPPLSGWFYDITGSYDMTFIFAGIVLAFSGVMLLLIPLVKKTSHQKRMK